MKKTVLLLISSLAAASALGQVATTTFPTTPSSAIRVVTSAPVTGAITSATCTLATSTGCVTSTTDGFATATVSVAGTYAGVTLTFELLDANGWQATSAARLTQPIQESSVALATNQSLSWGVSVYGSQQFRVRATAWSSGSASISVIYSSAAIDEAPTVSVYPSASAANQTAAINVSTLIEKGPRWTVTSTPAVSNLATASKGAGAAGVRHVCDCVTFSGGSTTAPAATKLTVNLRDGASGAGTIIHSWTVVVLAATGQNVAPFTACGLNLVGTAATAMTLEFSSLLTNLFEDATITGYDVQ